MWGFYGFLASSRVLSIVILRIVAKISIEEIIDPMKTPANMPMSPPVHAFGSVGFIIIANIEPPLMIAPMMLPMMPQTIDHRNIMKPFLIAKPQDTISITKRMVVIL